MHMFVCGVPVRFVMFFCLFFNIFNIKQQTKRNKMNKKNIVLLALMCGVVCQDAGASFALKLGSEAAGQGVKQADEVGMMARIQNKFGDAYKSFKKGAGEMIDSAKTRVASLDQALNDKLARRMFADYSSLDDLTRESWEQLLKRKRQLAIGAGVVGGGVGAGVAVHNANNQNQSTQGRQSDWQGFLYH